MMKNKKILIIIPVVLVAFIAVYAGIMLSGRGITATELDAQFVQVIENNGCLQCHAAEPDAFWYQKLPGFTGLFEKDMTNGYRSIDLEKVVNQINSGETVNIADVAKLEQATLNNDMPVIQYTIVHWGADLNSKEQQIVYDWVREKRTAHVEAFANKYSMTMNDTFISEPVMPLPDPSKFDVNNEKAMLGLAMYHDTRLSIDSTVSCASCHALDSAGQDNSRFARGVGSQFGGISAPSVYNAVFNVQQFWNGRAPDLQGQAGGPPANPIEMGYENWDDIVAYLRTQPDLVARFAAIYGAEGITQNTVTDAIAEFERLLVTPNSPFDKYLLGDKTALTSEEVQGYELFKKNYCATCHVGASMGGQSFEKLGTVVDAAVYYAERGTEQNGDDQGLFGFTGIEDDRYKFKVPNLRNVAKTAPYMHDGTHVTLEDAVRTMFRFNTPTAEPSDDTVNKIVLFLNTLNGENEYMTYKNVPTNLDMIRE